MRGFCQKVPIPALPFTQHQPRPPSETLLFPSWAEASNLYRRLQTCIPYTRMASKLGCIDTPVGGPLVTLDVHVFPASLQSETFFDLN